MFCRKTKFAIIPLLKSFPLSFFKARFKKTLIGILYHSISDESIPHIRNLYAYRSIKKFEEDMVFMKDNFNLMSYDDIVSCFLKGGALPSNPAFVSFDDGLKESFTNALPILKKYDIPCIFFITTNLIDNKEMLYTHKISLCIENIKNCSEDLLNKIFSIIKVKFKRAKKNRNSITRLIRLLNLKDIDTINTVAKILGINFSQYLETLTPYLTTEQINTLISEGNTIGSHGKQHISLGDIDRDSAIREITESCSFLKSRFNINKMGFSFPFSGNNLDTKRLLKNFEDARSIELFFDSNGVGIKNDLIVNRIGIDFVTFRDANNIDLGEIIKWELLKNTLRFSKK
ncbi:MAG: polysaccharide deacetylase family protein [bacterium]